MFIKWHFLFKSRGVFFFYVLNIQIFIQQKIMGAINIFVKIIKNTGSGWQLKQKRNTGREIINFTFDLKGSLQLPKYVAFGYFFS